MPSFTVKDLMSHETILQFIELHTSEWALSGRKTYPKNLFSSEGPYVGGYPQRAKSTDGGCYLQKEEHDWVFNYSIPCNTLSLYNKLLAAAKHLGIKERQKVEVRKPMVTIHKPDDEKPYYWETRFEKIEYI